MTHFLIGAVLATLLVPGAQRRDCRHEARREAVLRAASSDDLVLIARAGDLRVEGRTGQTEVRVSGRACASSEELLERLQLEVGRSGSTVRIEVPEIEWEGGWQRNRYASLDLQITVPAGMAADIRDGSGDTWLAGLGALRLVDGSGEVHIENAGGPVDIRDGSGELFVRDVDGDLVIQDGSGEIDIRGVTGSVTLRDGSGEIKVEQVGGSVNIPVDGSGEVTVRDVRGDLIVSRKGGGSVSYREVRGRVEVPERRRRR